MIRNVLLLGLLTSHLFSHSQTLLFEENFDDGIPETWITEDKDGLEPAPEVSYFNNAWISYETDTVICVGSTSFYEPSGQSQDYLITPLINIPSYSNIIWESRSVDASFPDSYVVLLSTMGPEIENFTDTLLSVYNETPHWHTRSVRIDEKGFANQDIHVAFKNITEDGFILLLDDIKFYGSEFAEIAENNNQQEIYLFPNPASNEVNIDVANLVSARIMDIQGKELIHSTEKHIDVSSLPNGIYMVYIQSVDTFYHLKFVKN
ncbi:T9SS-dependent choice-of-anchor J family protein [Crocinitomix algicola]|uniref:T9SS-dependent choice-of-anchor J family protein n=1 Tax=Crocinitomix algicola TaxID=1740263 RepID=UPI0008721A4C|nr:choice-of-anchor J domain-containing protein [Crocinitomix algicola]